MSPPLPHIVLTAETIKKRTCHKHIGKKKKSFAEEKQRGQEKIAGHIYDNSKKHCNERTVS